MTDQHELIQALSQWKPPEIPQPKFRLYHDAQGRPLRYSMQDEPGLWIEVTCEQYHRASSKVRVRAGKLESTAQPQVRKLKPAAQGQSCSAMDICIVTHQEPVQHWRFEHDQD